MRPTGRRGIETRASAIDNEARLAGILKLGLERAGFAVDITGRYADAKAVLAHFTYDAAILDLGLPDGDGIMEELAGGYFEVRLRRISSITAALSHSPSPFAMQPCMRLV